MGLKFYVGGTTGAQNGTLLSDGDMTNPLIFDGMYPATGVTVSKLRSIHIRADAGETWHWVQVQVRGAYSANFGLTSNVGANDGYHSSIGCLLLATVTDVNQPITISGSCSGSDTNSPDVTSKLVAWGWKV